MKRWRLAVVLGLGVAVVVPTALSIKTTREVSRLRAVSGDSFSAPDDKEAAVLSAVSYARSLLGKPYDLLMGRFGDPLGKVGFIVCIDVPVRAYQAAGLSMPALLRESAKQHPEWFAIGPDNPPSSSFFYRRVRNYHPLFKNHPSLVVDSKPKVGDWAFYGTTHIAIVVSVQSDGKFEVIEASPVKGRTAVSGGDYMAATWGEPAFFGRLR